MAKNNEQIESSFLLIADRQYNIVRGWKTELNSEFIKIPIDMGTETLLTSLSFKHVLRVEIVHGSTAGLVLHINEFMAKKLQHFLKDGGIELPQSPDSPKRSIVLDMLNCDAQKLTAIREILHSAGIFHHNYGIEQMEKNKKFINSKAIPQQPFLSTISKLQWNAILDRLGAAQHPWPHGHGGEQGQKSQLATGGGEGGNNAKNIGRAKRLKKLAGIPAEKEIWIETSYFYHAETCETTWQRPKSANAVVIAQDELLKLAMREGGDEDSIGNRWKESNPNVTISGDGLKLENTTESHKHVYAEKGFDISGDSRNEDNFTETIIYYFEVTRTSSAELLWLRIGFSDGSIPEGEYVGHCTNSYSITYGFYYDLNKDYCWISGKKHDIEWPEGVIKPEWNEPKIGDVYGCGLLLSPDNELAIFFTLNGILIGKPIPISPWVYFLYPTITILTNGSLEANFGDNPAKPFSFDIDKCPQL